MTDTAKGRRWTPETVRALGVTTDLATAASVLGIGRSKAYELVHNDQFPVPLIKTGTRYVVPTAPLLAILGADESPDPTGEHASGPTPRKPPSDAAYRDLAHVHARALHTVHARIEETWRQQGQLPPEADGLWTAIGRFLAVYGSEQVDRPVNRRRA